jgi:hypothetical protein
MNDKILVSREFFNKAMELFTKEVRDPKDPHSHRKWQIDPDTSILRAYDEGTDIQRNIHRKLIEESLGIR